MHIVRILRICSDYLHHYPISLSNKDNNSKKVAMFLMRGKQTTVVMWCSEVFKNNPELQKVGTQFTFFDLPSLLC